MIVCITLQTACLFLMLVELFIIIRSSLMQTQSYTVKLLCLSAVIYYCKSEIPPAVQHVVTGNPFGLQHVAEVRNYKQNRSCTRFHPQLRSDVLGLRRFPLIELFCYSSRSIAWRTNVKWENSMCKPRWDANRKEELPSEEIRVGGDSH